MMNYQNTPLEEVSLSQTKNEFFNSDSVRMQQEKKWILVTVSCQHHSWRLYVIQNEHGQKYWLNWWHLCQEKTYTNISELLPHNNWETPARNVDQQSTSKTVLCSHGVTVTTTSGHISYLPDYFIIEKW